MKKILWDLLTEMENGTGKADTYYEILRLMKAIDTETTKPVNVDLADINLRFNNKLRDKFFVENTANYLGTPKIVVHPHNVFEWFKKNVG